MELVIKVLEGLGSEKVMLPKTYLISKAVATPAESAVEMSLN